MAYINGQLSSWPAGADPGFLEKGVHIYKGVGFALLILSYFS